MIEDLDFESCLTSHDSQLALRIDGVCDQFEEVWKSQFSPSISDFIEGWHGSERAILVRELIETDVACRLERAIPVSKEHYESLLRPSHAWLNELLADQDDFLPFPEASTSCDKEITTPRRIGRFEICCVLGSGGFGTVYRAFDPFLKREVALKIAHNSFAANGDAAERFLIEARAAAKLNHPNIVPVYDAGEPTEARFIASALVAGRTLKQIITEDGPLHPYDAGEIVRQLAEALNYAHRKGVIHRDVKPHNVIVDEEGVPYLMDFGLARLEDSEHELTLKGTFLGTPAYMSPEQARRGSRNAVGPASDQYSLGVLLYELLVGKVPFKGANEFVVYQVLTQDAQSIRSARRDVPRELETICQKAMSKSASKRYISCLHMAADLHRWQKGLPIRARRVRATERIARLCWRNPLMTGMTAALILIVFFFALAQSDLDQQIEEYKMRLEILENGNVGNPYLQAEVDRMRKDFGVFLDQNPQLSQQSLESVAAIEQRLAALDNRASTLFALASPRYEPYEIARVDGMLDLAPPSDLAHENVLASVAMSTAPNQANLSELLSVTEPGAIDARITIAEELTALEGVKLDELIRKGAVGEEIEHVEGAVDRLTHEIARNLEERDVLVVWLMDASGSLTTERAEAADRLNRVYEELKQLGAVADEALLSSVIQFGEQRNTLVDATADGAEVARAINTVTTDESGVENTFQAITATVEQYKTIINRDKRKLLLVIWTDESGDDYAALEKAVATCQRFNASVYTVGPSAMFGKEDGTRPYVAPENGETYYLPISRGPDTLRQEQVQVPFWFNGNQYRNLNSGLGPFALTRLCQSTGGIYFIKDDPQERNQFELNVMMNYTPEYDSANEYISRAKGSKFRSAILQSVDVTMQRTLKGTPRLEFEPKGGTYYNELKEAQELVAYNIPIIEAALIPFTELGLEEHYQKEPSARWRAWYDFNRGRLLAMRARCYEYNWRCAELKGLSREFVEEKSNRWRFKPAEEFNFGSQTKNDAIEARRLLMRCIENNPGTPWAILAQRELKDPMGFRVEEAYVAPPLPPERVASGNNNPPQGTRTEQPRRLTPPVKPKLPKL